MRKNCLIVVFGGRPLGAKIDALLARRQPRREPKKRSRSKKRLVCDHLSLRFLAFLKRQPPRRKPKKRPRSKKNQNRGIRWSRGGRWDTKSWFKTLSPMRVSGWFVIISAVGAWGCLGEAAVVPKVGLKPCLPCAFRVGL